MAPVPQTPLVATEASGSAGSVRRARPLAFAHRGGKASAPENSLEAFTSALREGVTALESDVWVSPQGRLLLSHGVPKGPSLALEELYERCGTDIDLSLDVPAAAAEAVLEVARRAGQDLSRLYLCGQSRDLPAWRLLDSDVRLVADARRHQLLPLRARHLDELAGAGVDVLNLRQSWWSRGLVTRVHGAGLLAFAWDVQTRRQRDRVLGLGCDGFYSDHLPLLATMG